MQCGLCLLKPVEHVGKLFFLLAKQLSRNAFHDWMIRKTSQSVVSVTIRNGSSYAFQPSKTKQLVGGTLLECCFVAQYREHRMKRIVCTHVPLHLLERSIKLCAIFTHPFMREQTARGSVTCAGRVSYSSLMNCIRCQPGLDFTDDPLLGRFGFRSRWTNCR